MSTGANQLLVRSERGWPLWLTYDLFPFLSGQAFRPAPGKAVVTFRSDLSSTGKLCCEGAKKSNLSRGSFYTWPALVTWPSCGNRSVVFRRSKITVKLKANLKLFFFCKFFENSVSSTAIFRTFQLLNFS